MPAHSEHFLGINIASFEHKLLTIEVVKGNVIQFRVVKASMTALLGSTSPLQYCILTDNNIFRICCTCPLMFYGSDVCIREVPVLCQYLPLAGFQVFGG